MEIRTEKVGDGLTGWTYAPRHSGRQKDGSSCGVFVCMVIYSLCIMCGSSIFAFLPVHVACCCVFRGKPYSSALQFKNFHMTCQCLSYALCL